MAGVVYLLAKTHLTRIAAKGRPNGASTAHKAPNPTEFRSKRGPRSSSRNVRLEKEGIELIGDVGLHGLRGTFASLWFATVTVLYGLPGSLDTLSRTSQ